MAKCGVCQLVILARFTIAGRWCCGALLELLVLIPVALLAESPPRAVAGTPWRSFVLELTFLLSVVFVIFYCVVAPLRYRASAGPGGRLAGRFHGHGWIRALGVHGGLHHHRHLRGALGLGGWLLVPLDAVSAPGICGPLRGCSQGTSP